MQLKVLLSKNSFRAKIYQTLLLTSLTLIFCFLIINTLDNMQQRGIQGGFGFILDPAGFDISESWIEFTSDESYAKAFLVGLINTLRVSLASIVTCTFIGLLLGLGRVQSNPLVRFLCRSYTEIFRNIPLLIQLLIWYVLLVEWLPDSQTPLQLGLANFSVFLSKDGLAFPWLELNSNSSFFSSPLFDGTNIVGGGVLTPEFIALYIGLSLYTAAFVGELIRAGFQSIDKGQIEAGLSIGLKASQITRLIVMPQALKVIIPPLTNQYLNLIKNSSLAVAIGYPDLVNVSNTSLNQTGHAIECVFIIMIVYLLLSLLISLIMNSYNAQVMKGG
jgi:general L-amino acid transport system permease protein